MIRINKDFMVIEVPYLEVDELMLIFGYENRTAFHAALRSKALPIPTFTIGRRIVADKEVVRRFFAWRRREGVMELDTAIRTAILAQEAGL